MEVREKALEAALKKLNLRARTEKEIRDHLREAGYEADIITDVVAELKSYRYIDDERYCREYFAYGKSRGKGSCRICQELAQKGVSAAVARDVIAELLESEEFRGQDDKSTALETGRKMARQQGDTGKELDEKFYARVGRRLAGKGYDSSTIYWVLGKLKQDARELEEE